MQEVITHIVAALAGAVAGYTFCFRVHIRAKRTQDTTRVTQEDIRTRGDVAGRDINKK